jgi:hypothetical protein
LAEGEARFVICVRNDEYPASLETRKIYQEVLDPDAAETDLIRVIDESGEDYLFPRKLFVPVELPGEIKAALLRAS